MLCWGEWLPGGLGAPPPCGRRSPGALGGSPSAGPRLDPGGGGPIRTAEAEQGFVLPRGCVLAVRSRGSAGFGLAGTVKPYFLEYKTCPFLSSPGPRQAALPSLEVQLPGSFLPPTPPLPRQQPLWCQEVARRGVRRGSAPPKLHQSKPCQTNTPNSLPRR